jgi:hypothetical protein
MAKPSGTPMDDGDEGRDRGVPADRGAGLPTGEAEHLEHGDLAPAPAGRAGDRVPGWHRW